MAEFALQSRLNLAEHLSGFGANQIWLGFGL